MNAQAREQLVADWIEHHARELKWSADHVLERQNLHPEAVDRLHSLVVDEPEVAWDLILAIVHANRSDDVMGNLAPMLGILLEHNPDLFIERLEQLAVSDPYFKELLAWLIPSEPTSPFWSRVRRSAGDVQW